MSSIVTETGGGQRRAERSEIDALPFDLQTRAGELLRKEQLMLEKFIKWNGEKEVVIAELKERLMEAEEELWEVRRKYERLRAETKRSEAEEARRRREAALEAFDADVEHRRATLAAQPRFGVPRVAWGLPATRGARVQEHWRTPQAKHENTSTKHGVPRGSSPQGTMPQDYGSNKAICDLSLDSTSNAAAGDNDQLGIPDSNDIQAISDSDISDDRLLETDKSVEVDRVDIVANSSLFSVESNMVEEEYAATSPTCSNFDNQTSEKKSDSGPKCESSKSQLSLPSSKDTDVCSNAINNLSTSTDDTDSKKVSFEENVITLLQSEDESQSSEKEPETSSSQESVYYVKWIHFDQDNGDPCQLEDDSLLDVRREGRPLHYEDSLVDGVMEQSDSSKKMLHIHPKALGLT